MQRRSFLLSSLAALCAPVVSLFARAPVPSPSDGIDTSTVATPPGSTPTPYRLLCSMVVIPTKLTLRVPKDIRPVHFPLEGSAEEIAYQATANAAFICANMEFPSDYDACIRRFDEIRARLGLLAYSLRTP